MIHTVKKPNSQQGTLMHGNHAWHNWAWKMRNYSLIDISLRNAWQFIFFTHFTFSKLLKKWKRATLLLSSPKTMKTWWLWHMRCHKKELFYQAISSQANENDKKMPIFDFWGTFFLPPSLLSDFPIITCPSRPRMSFLGWNKDCCKKSFFSRSTQMIDRKISCSQRTSLLPPSAHIFL